MILFAFFVDKGLAVINTINVKRFCKLLNVNMQTR